jgi:hypothetical protein
MAEAVVGDNFSIFRYGVPYLTAQGFGAIRKFLRIPRQKILFF